MTDFPATAEHGPPNEEELLPLSGLQHVVFCPRQCALIHVEGVFAENRFTLEGHHLHERVDEAGTHSEAGCRVARSLPLVSRRLGVFGIADVVEFHGECPFPVEYKRGRRRQRLADQIQLCAQAMALEEMFHCEIPAGALFYDASKRRLDVRFDETLRATTTQAAADYHALVRAQRTPPPVNDDRCEDCSLRDDCLPSVAAKPANVTRYIRSLYGETP
ncbi:MAG: CRISPR-associated protein Cas4 [Verrucomicrobia bacterium]|nr:CRISPR-associated protein Cas4 [Verrucomicrobiota bacterium]